MANDYAIRFINTREGDTPARYFALDPKDPLKGRMVFLPHAMRVDRKIAFQAAHEINMDLAIEGKPERAIHEFVGELDGSISL